VQTILQQTSAVLSMRCSFHWESQRILIGMKTQRKRHIIHNIQMEIKKTHWQWRRNTLTQQNWMTPSKKLLIKYTVCKKLTKSNWALHNATNGSSKATEEQQELWRSWSENIQSGRGLFPQTSSHQPVRSAGWSLLLQSSLHCRSPRQNHTELRHTAVDCLPHLPQTTQLCRLFVTLGRHNIKLLPEIFSFKQSQIRAGTSNWHNYQYFISKVRIDRKELGGGGGMSKGLKFCPGMEI